LRRADRSKAETLAAYNPFNPILMKERTIRLGLQHFLLAFCLLADVAVLAQAAASPSTTASSVRAGNVAEQASGGSAPGVCARCIRAHMEFLASDALRGRGSGTPDELLAATYVAAQLEQYGVAPAGDHGGYIQQAPVIRQVLSAPPVVWFMTPGGSGVPAHRVEWTHGKEMLALSLADTEFEGPLKTIDTDRGGASLEQISYSENKKQDTPAMPAANRGAVVLIRGKDPRKVREAKLSAEESGAIAVFVPASGDDLLQLEKRAKDLPKLPLKLAGTSGSPGLGEGSHNEFALSDDAVASLSGIPDGTTFYLETTTAPPEKSSTWNAVGKITGSDPKLRNSVIMLSAHLDHLGIGPPVNGDAIYNGADDDASGTTAVLEVARVLARGPKPRRTVVFALFGSEEDGGLGSSWFEAHPPVPLANVAANLEFEMIGRRDPKYPDDSLWLSGWDRTNLGPALAAHGAKLVKDERPEEHFFMRSDNYVFAKKGVVAQTASSFGLHADYHQPSDDLAHIDFQHMRVVIASLIEAVEWLVNSEFRPRWVDGGRP
jgi:aminopeptidase YwaD